MTPIPSNSTNDSPQALNPPLQEKPQTSQPQEIQPSEPEKPPKKPRPKIPKPVRIVGAIVLLAGIGFGVYRVFFYEPEPPGIFMSGRIEGYETDVSAKMGGRAETVAVREGDLVKPGQLLVRLSDADIQAQLQGAIARVSAAQERLQRARQQLPVLQAQLEQAKLTTQQARQESEGRVLEAQNSVAAARAQLVEAQENLQLARTEQRRIKQLSAQGVVPAQRLDEANAALGTAQARVVAARQQVEAAQGRLQQAQATAQNPSIRAAQELQIQKQIAQAQTDISVSEQEVRDAKANQAQIQAKLNDLVVESPMQGTVITRSVEPGEVVAAGAPLLTLVNQNQLYMRGFVPEGQIGNVKVGQPARVYLDSAPERPLEAEVSRIDPKASFTPENTYFKEDRVTQVFGVELTLEEPQSLAKQGMPADARILVPETTQPKSKQFKKKTINWGWNPHLNKNPEQVAALQFKNGQQP
jgi:HlyD family secretion protein